MVSTDNKVVVVGSGLGGLAAACTLAARGHRVQVLEKNTWLGGKAAVLEQDGAHIAPVDGDLGKGRDGVEARERARAAEELLCVGDHARTHLTKEPRLDLLHALLGVEDQGLVFFELRDDESLGVDQGLFADVGVGDSVEVGLSDLDVVAKDLVETNLEVSNPGVFAFLLFQTGDPSFGLFHSGEQVV